MVWIGVVDGKERDWDCINGIFNGLDLGDEGKVGIKNDF